MTGFVDEHRQTYGVEPCSVSSCRLPLPPTTSINAANANRSGVRFVPAATPNFVR